MENQKITIPWGDGSGEDLTLDIQENPSGEISIKVTSPKNSGLNRTKVLSISSSEHNSITLELSQGGDLGIGDMEVGISFIIS